MKLIKIHSTTFAKLKSPTRAYRAQITIRDHYENNRELSFLSNKKPKRIQNSRVFLIISKDCKKKKKKNRKRIRSIRLILTSKVFSHAFEILRSREKINSTVEKLSHQAHVPRLIPLPRFARFFPKHERPRYRATPFTPVTTKRANSSNYFHRLPPPPSWKPSMPRPTRGKIEKLAPSGLIRH